MTIIKRTGHIRMRCKMSLHRGSPDRIAVSPHLRLGQRPPLPLQQEQPLVILPLDLCAAFAQILYLNVAFKLSTESSGGRRGAGGRRREIVCPVQSVCVLDHLPPGGACSLLFSSCLISFVCVSEIPEIFRGMI